MNDRVHRAHFFGEFDSINFAAPRNAKKLVTITIRHGFSAQPVAYPRKLRHLFVGFVGCANQQIIDNFGQPAVLGGSRSRVLGAAPQMGNIFKIGDNSAFPGRRRPRAGYSAASTAVRCNLPVHF
jgi:hypothetical protein